jgi:hypothetical protein
MYIASFPAPLLSLFSGGHCTLLKGRMFKNDFNITLDVVLIRIRRARRRASFFRGRTWRGNVELVMILHVW